MSIFLMGGLVSEASAASAASPYPGTLTCTHPVASYGQWTHVLGCGQFEGKKNGATWQLLSFDSDYNDVCIQNGCTAVYDRGGYAGIRPNPYAPNCSWSASKPGARQPAH
jgi:hypothetical protein